MSVFWLVAGKSSPRRPESGHSLDVSSTPEKVLLFRGPSLNRNHLSHCTVGCRKATIYGPLLGGSACAQLLVLSVCRLYDGGASRILPGDVTARLRLAECSRIPYCVFVQLQTFHRTPSLKSLVYKCSM
jgi:hypothetical protein